MLVYDVKPIFNFSRNINTKDDIYKYVEEPMISICEYLYDLNVLTVMSSANTINGCYLIIDYDTLSEHNKKVFNDLLKSYPNFVSLGKFSVYEINNEVKIKMPFDKKTNSQDVFNYYSNLLKGIEIQEINSFRDCHNSKYNIYDIKTALLQVIIYFALIYFTENGKYVDYDLSSIENIDEGIINLEEKLGLIRVKNHESFPFITNKKYKDEYYLYHKTVEGGFIMTENVFIHIIQKHKDELFITKDNYTFDNVNRDYLLSKINDFQKDNYIYNSEDDRFYHNQELLNRHNKFINKCKTK